MFNACMAHENGEKPGRKWITPVGVSLYFANLATKNMYFVYLVISEEFTWKNETFSDTRFFGKLAHSQQLKRVF